MNKNLEKNLKKSIWEIRDLYIRNFQNCGLLKIELDKDGLVAIAKKNEKITMRLSYSVILDKWDFYEE